MYSTAPCIDLDCGSALLAGTGYTGDKRFNRIHAVRNLSIMYWEGGAGGGGPLVFAAVILVGALLVWQFEGREQRPNSRNIFFGKKSRPAGTIV